MNKGVDRYPPEQAPRLCLDCGRRHMSEHCSPSTRCVDCGRPRMKKRDAVLCQRCYDRIGTVTANESVESIFDRIKRNHPDELKPLFTGEGK